MRRHTIAPRQGWKEIVAETGLTYNTLADGTPYWDESAYWEFSSAEVDRIEAASNEIYRLALAAGDHILQKNRLEEMKIPAAAAARIREMWQMEPPALYSRLDLAYDGRQIKLLEYNADTPTALVEAAVTQWYWLQECFPKADQFNSLHEKLVAKWRDLVPYLKQPVYFGHDGSDEDFMTISYLRDTAEQAGLKTADILMPDIGFNQSTFTFVGLDEQPIQTLFKLYPWEMLLKEEFGQAALDFMHKTQWIEPIWKMMFSNKGLLAILWEMHPNHELLLPAYLDGPRDLRDYVRKPLLSREGANIQIVQGGEKTQTYGPYGEEGFVFQALAPIADFGGKRPVLGSWMIDQDPAGMGIREADGPITNNLSRFVPHLFR